MSRRGGVLFSDEAGFPPVAVVPADLSLCLRQHPGPADVALVVEVADTSLARDRGIKQQMYAQAGIPVYWIANLVDRRIGVFTDPDRGAQRPEYRQSRHYGPEDALPAVLDGAEVGSLPVGELLP